jgi:DNA-binding NarL/FixJ family response regulator
MEIPNYSEEDSPGVPAMLTGNQLYLAQLVAFGFNDKAIAHRMGSIAGTVKKYLVRLRTTLHPVDTAMNLRVQLYLACTVLIADAEAMRRSA